MLVAVGGLAVGGLIRHTGGPVSPETLWMAATLPVVAALGVSILRDLWIGRLGVDAIALVSMSAALLLDQPLAAIVIADAFSMRATAPAADSTYAAIVSMVAAAQISKAPFIRMADRFALVLLPATLLVAGAAWYLAGDPIRGLAVLVVATPRPLVLAAPVAFIGGVSFPARTGVLMKESAALEDLSEIRTAAFDKTGTLTVGGAHLIETELAPGCDGSTALQRLASLEQASHHVLAGSIIREAEAKALKLSHPWDVKEYRGSGLKAL